MTLPSRPDTPLAAWYLSGTCEWCGALWWSEKRRGRPRRFCGDACQADHRDLNSRPRRLGLLVAEVFLVELLERDGRTCGICRQAIADDETITFDHVITYALGGVHAPWNVQLAHFPCNRRKGAHVTEDDWRRAAELEAFHGV